MKFTSALSAAALTAMLATSAMAQECTSASAPTVPDGRTATEQQMADTHQAIKTYMGATDAYLSCLEDQGKRVAQELNQDKSLSDKERQSKLQAANGEITAKHNAAVDEMQRVAGEFNAAVRAFKAANPQ